MYFIVHLYVVDLELGHISHSARTHTIRHWRATILYHETKDIRFVQRFLGHRNILNTEHYIHLEAYFQDTEEQYITKVADDVENAIPLIEAGFELAAEYGEAKIFKKKITQWCR